MTEGGDAVIPRRSAGSGFELLDIRFSPPQLLRSVVVWRAEVNRSEAEGNEFGCGKYLSRVRGGMRSANFIDVSADLGRTSRGEVVRQDAVKGKERLLVGYSAAAQLNWPAIGPAEYLRRSVSAGVNLEMTATSGDRVIYLGSTPAGPS